MHPFSKSGYRFLGRNLLPFHSHFSQLVKPSGDLVRDFFSRKALRGASFNSIEQLRQAIEVFVAAYGPTAKPFMGRKREVKGSQLKNTIVN